MQPIITDIQVSLPLQTLRKPLAASKWFFFYYLLLPSYTRCGRLAIRHSPPTCKIPAPNNLHRFHHKAPLREAILRCVESRTDQGDCRLHQQEKTEGGGRRQSLWRSKAGKGRGQKENRPQPRLQAVVLKSKGYQPMSTSGASVGTFWPTLTKICFTSPA